LVLDSSRIPNEYQMTGWQQGFDHLFVDSAIVSVRESRQILTMLGRVIDMAEVDY
jgi:hypothetical protein